MRERRSRLSSTQQQAASLAICALLIQDPVVQSAQNIAVYVPQDGEPDLMPFIQWAWQQQKKLALPCIHPEQVGQMHFRQYSADSVLRPNRYGILEPDSHTAVCLEAFLDILLIPLVAFDHQGRRLGMGGGYYDRAIARLKVHNPKLALYGIAHECQRVDELLCESWDVPMQKIFTEQSATDS